VRGVHKPPQVFLTDVEDRPAINPVRQEIFGTARPASTLVEVGRLAIPGAKIEVEAVAVLPEPGRPDGPSPVETEA
jgi:enamine deaminase RidA (YjgF/YER057c/UK114 family)